MYIERNNMTTGIYLLSFPNTNKVYIGQSINIKNRFRDHLNDMLNNREPKKLQEAYNRYGIPTCEIECSTTVEELNSKENYYISLWNSQQDGFNTLAIASTTPILYGENNPASLYTTEQILDVISLLIEFPNENYKYISELTSVSIQVIRNIFAGRAYTWIKDKYTEMYNKLEQVREIGRVINYSKGVPLTQLVIEEVFTYIVDNPEISLTDISDITGLSRSIIYSISVGKTHKYLESKYPDKYKYLSEVSTIRINNTNIQRFATKEYPLLINKEGNIEKVITLTSFANKHKLDMGALSKLLSEKIDYHKGWWVYRP